MVGLSALHRARRWSPEQRNDEAPARGSPVGPALRSQQRRWGNAVYDLDEKSNPIGENAMLGLIYDREHWIQN